MTFLKAKIFILMTLFYLTPVFGYVWEGFEKDNLWFITVMNNNAINNIKTSLNQKSEGNASLEIDLTESGTENKGFLSREGLFNLSKIEQCTFDLYAEQPFKLSMGLSTGPDFEWSETDDILIKKGWNKNLNINFTLKKWKSKKTKWKFTTTPNHIDKVKKILFVFKFTKRSKAYLDNIRFTGKILTNQAYTMVYEPLEKTKLIDELALLNKASPAKWAKPYSPGIKKEGNAYILDYSEVDNVNKAAYKLRREMDWTKYSKVILKVKNMSKDYCCLAIGFQVTSSWLWYESPQFLLKPDQTTDVVICLTAPYFKSETYKWNYIDYLYEKSDLKALNVLIYGVYQHLSSGKVSIQSIQLLKGRPFSLRLPEEIDKEDDEKMLKEQEKEGF